MESANRWATPPEMHDDEAPPSPEASLRLIAEQRRVAQQGLDIDPARMLVPWGLAWLVGYGLFFLRFGPDDRVFVSMPEWLPLAVLVALLGLAGLVCGLAGARAQHGVAGESAERGAMYGLSWFVAFAGMAVLATRFDDLLAAADAGLMWGSLPVFVTAVLYMSGGAVWRDRLQFGLGVWLSVANVAGLLAGPGWHSLVVCLAGGGGFLVTAGAYRLARPQPVSAAGA